MTARIQILKDAALAYRDNHHWVPLRLRGKVPVGRDWQQRALADAIPTFKQEDNVGILLGAPSGGLVRLDPDYQSIAAVRDILFPEPTALSGRTSSPRSGRLYICDGIKTTNFRLPNVMKDDPRLPVHDGRPNVTVFQILSTGAQTMAPPSIHPDSGEEVTWVNVGTEPKTLEKEELLLRAGVEAFCLVVRQFWPPRGSRNEAAMALARVLLETFATHIADEAARITTVDELVLAVAMAGGDGAASSDGKQRAAATLERMKVGEETIGLSRLIELLDLPPIVAKNFRKWLGLSTQAAPLAARFFSSGVDWRERRANGTPVASMHNARLGIVAMGIECRHDLFRDLTIIGFRGDEVVHEIKPLIGELTNVALLRLRLMFSARFGFDPEDKHILDAVKTLAFENCFDPILDLLDKAQAEWDKTARLDNWVVTYLGCEDTPLNKAIGRKVLIAAARRARHPGCKFDNITVLEGPEGKNKSTAIRILAGDEFFSDQSVLGARDKEVQEQLTGIWMHESADLAGIRRADVEHVKAFASRQADRARPAYGRVRETRPRRSIEWGTTNSDEYLQSSTGNRRFWPLTVNTMIDLDLLRRDRLQLLGEAATYESTEESITLNEALWATAGEEQEKRRTKDPWEDIVANIPESVQFRVGEEEHIVKIIHLSDDGALQVVASSTVLTHVLHIPVGQQHTGHSMRLALAMKKAGWQREKIIINGKRGRGYTRRDRF